jgi:hypothetical protein
MSYLVTIINLAHRTDRREHILKQFSDKPEFTFTIVPAIEHTKGAYGLWKTIQLIVSTASLEERDFVILCEDDHTFTEHYSFKFLKNCVEQAIELDADLLSGGYSWFANAVQVTENLFWVDKFNGMQFTVIFQKFYETILNANFGEDVVTDIYLSNLTDNKFVTYPNISTQKEFGYSDVTPYNGQEGYINVIFRKSINRFNILNKVRNYYFKQQNTQYQ